MEMENILFKKYTSQKSQKSIMNISNSKRKRLTLEGNLKKNDFSVKLKREKSRLNKLGFMSQKNIAQGNYFKKKLLKMKEEINKNEFSNLSEETFLENNIDNSNAMRQLGTNIRHSLAQLKIENSFYLSPRHLSPKHSQKYFKDQIKAINNNDLGKKKSIITINEIFSPKKEKKNKEFLSNIFNKLNVTNSTIDIDSSSRQLLYNIKSNSKLVLLANEENNINDNSLNSKSNEVKKIKSRRNSSVYTSKPLRNEKFRRLFNKGLVYDSFDDDEDMEDQINNYYFIMPNSLSIIILDTLVAIIVLYYLIWINKYIV